MADKTGISWTHATWNPVTGCSKVSTGCKHCYAERDWNRLVHLPPYQGRSFTDVMCHADRLGQPLRWQKPRMVFVNSMSDLFHEDVPFAFIDQVFAVMALAERHTFQILTKRHQRMREYMESRSEMNGYQVDNIILGWDVEHWPFGEKRPELGFSQDFGLAMPPRNVWMGVTVEDQDSADERIQTLLETPAHLRWLSMEPLLGPVNISPFLERHLGIYGNWREGSGIDWVVLGAESGPKARHMENAWAEDIRRQCEVRGVPVFVKQLTGSNGRVVKTVDDFPESLRVQSFPQGPIWASLPPEPFVYLEPDQYHQVVLEAERVCKEAMLRNEDPVNPYLRGTEAHAIFDTIRFDVWTDLFGDDEFEVLGIPIPVTVVEEHGDGAVTYSIPSTTAGEHGESA